MMPIKKSPKYYKKKSRTTKLTTSARNNRDYFNPADFLARLSHDLKTPLTIILNYSDMLVNLKKERLDDEAEMMLRGMKEGAESMLGIIDSMMEMSKAESGRMCLSPASVDVGQLLKELSSFYSAIAQRRGLDFRLEMQEALPHAVADGASLKSAFSNLVHNAICYTPRGGRIVLQAKCHPEPSGSHLSVAVSDTGPGIQPGERSLIFEKFFSSNKTGKKGSGIGLWIVKNVAEAHGGSVELESEPGCGSTFRILIPVRQTRADRDN